MTKTRYVGGNATLITKGTTKYFAKEIEISSNGRIEYFAPDYSFGDPDPRPVFKEPEIAFSGWWSPDYEGTRNIERDSQNSKAYLDETVYFQLNVCDHIPVGTNITFQLWDKDTPFLTPIFDDVKFDDKRVFRNAIVREVDGKRRITIELFLNPRWHNDVIKDQTASYNACLEFYWTWKYNNQYWRSNNNVLDVFMSRTTLFIKPAYEGYGCPEFRSADGELIVFSAGIVALKEPSQELDKIMDTIVDDIKDNAIAEIREKMVKYSDKLQYSIAVKQLKKGYLANNMGKIEFSRKVYTKPVFDNNGELYEITKAANFGYKKDGELVTTKGISQLDYFKEVGVRSNIAKASKELLGIFEFSDIISFAMNEKPETIMTGFAPADFVVAVFAPEILDSIKENWDSVVYDLAEKAKDRGLRGVNEFLQSSAGQEKRYKYGITKIGQEILEKLIKKEFKSLKELQEKQLMRNQYQEDLSYTLFHYVHYNQDLDKDFVFIDSIFANY